MQKTIKQIADELGVEKQKVYRFIKRNHINEAHQENGVMYYDEAAQNLLNKEFLKNTASNEAHQNHINDAANEAVIDMLKSEIEFKNKLINELKLELNTERQHSRELSDKLVQLADQSQRLQLAQLTNDNSFKLLTEQNTEFNKPTFFNHFRKFFNKKSNH
jgi:IS30 family transposase